MVPILKVLLSTIWTTSIRRFSRSRSSWSNSSRLSFGYVQPTCRSVNFSRRLYQVTKGNQKINFFTIPEYEQWLENTPDSHRWKSKYYKVFLTNNSEARHVIE